MAEEQATVSDGHGTTIEFRSLDGIGLSGTLVVPPTAVESATVLVHGGGVTRDEGGFFSRLAFGLSQVGIASLRFDLRGHGRSEGRQEDLTLSGVANDIRAAVAYVRTVVGGRWSAGQRDRGELQWRYQRLVRLASSAGGSTVGTAQSADRL